MNLHGEAIGLPTGFIIWDGLTTECPCPGKAVDVMFRDGKISRACVQMPKADGWSWKHHNHPTGDIVAYRIIEKPDF